MTSGETTEMVSKGQGRKRTRSKKEEEEEEEVPEDDDEGAAQKLWCQKKTPSKL